MTPSSLRRPVSLSRLPRRLSRRVRLAQLLPLLLLTAALLLCGSQQAQAANLPTGGSVAAGSASIGTATGNALTVTQTSSSAVINWQSFSVGQGYSVNFVQPSSSSVILNRVTGSTTSTIAGSITANGQVYLINPNGIVITATGTVNTAAFVASTLGISDDDFMAGKRTFTGSGASAAVTNAGTITIGRGGYAALLGGSVDNAGSIIVPLGKVGLGSGEQATLDLSGDGFLQVAIPTSATGSGALVANSGTILADGGLVMLSAAAAKDMARQAINMSGTIEAKTVSGQTGDIVLAGSNGAVDISGTLLATGTDASSSDSTGAGATGGTITVTGRAITLTGATFDASGRAGGGSIKIGGDRQGSGTLQHADTLTVDARSTITVDATSTGNGGDVVLWSDDLTTFAGTISAKGGAISGNGGQAEVSGKALLSYTGFTDLSAAHGSFGTLLLDPYNVTISDATSSNQSSFTATGTNSVINAATLITALGSADVTVSTGSSGTTEDGNITVAAALAWSSGSTLTLTAANSIAVNANITIAGSGGLVLTYGSGGDLTFASGASVTYTNADGSAATTSQGGRLTINSVSYTLLYSMADIDGIDGTAASSNAINSQTEGLTGHYALAKSLVATGTTYTDALVGVDDSHTFTGTFEGLGNTITGLTIAKDGSYAGLFGYVGSGGVVRDIGLLGGTVSGTGNDVGGLAGYNAGTISNAWVTSAVSGTGRVTVTWVDDHSGDPGYYDVTGGSYNVGGLVGYSSGTISNAYATGAVSGTRNSVGGLVGANSGMISDAYATGAVSGPNSYPYGSGGSTYVGGLAGANYGTISNAYATGAVSGYVTVGGLAGYNSGTISDAYATGAVSGTRNVGGLVGYNSSSGTISNAYAAGAVSGTSYVGDLVAGNYGTISNSYTASSDWTAAKTAWASDSAWTFITGVTLPVLSAFPYILVTANAASRTYGDANPPLSASITLVSDGGTAGSTAGLTVATAATVASDVGSYAITVSGTAATGYQTAVISGILTVTPATLTVTAANASMTYGDTVPTLSYGVSGWKNGQTDSLLTSVTVTTDASSTSNAGNGYTTTASGGTLSGAASGNYNITYAAGTLTVTARPITVTANAASSVYGDTPSLTYSVGGSGLVNGDALSGSLASGTNTSAVGNYAITQGTLANSNYSITYTSANLTITARPITVTANAASSVYGDTPSLTYSVGGSGLVNGDALSGSLASGTSTSAVGNYAITQGSLANSNYSITSYTGNTLTIIARPITVTANAASSVYGDTPSLTYSVSGSGLVNGDTLTGNLATAATSSSNVGTYAITQGSLAASSNYTVSYTGAILTITARPITVTANSQSINQGSAIPALTYTVGGSSLVNSDTLSGSLETTATSSSTAGSYAITQGSLQASANYNLTFVSGLLSVTAKPLSDASVPPSIIAQSLGLNNAGANPATPTMPLTVTSSGSAIATDGGTGGVTVFSSPWFDGVVICPGGNCVAQSSL